jgi:hypothetical protein
VYKFVTELRKLVLYWYEVGMLFAAHLVFVVVLCHILPAVRTFKSGSDSLRSALMEVHMIERPINCYISHFALAWKLDMLAPAHLGCGQGSGLKISVGTVFGGHPGQKSVCVCVCVCVQDLCAQM